MHEGMERENIVVVWTCCLQSVNRPYGRWISSNRSSGG